MNGSLLKFFGVNAEDAANAVDAHLELRNIAALPWIMGALLALGALAWWGYRFRSRELSLAPGRNRLLISLRSVLFLLLLFLLLRPVISLAIESSLRRLLPILIDTSTSMNIQDPRVDAKDIERASIYGRVADPKHVSRIELVKAVLKDAKLHLLPDLQRRSDLATFGFGQDTVEIPQTYSPSGEADFSWLDNMTAKSPLTAIGDGVRDVISRKRGQPLAGVFLITDGGNNSGIQTAEAANLAQQEGVPLYIYGVGITSPRDIIVGNLFAPDVAFVKDELPVTVHVRGQGLKGESAEVTLKLGGETVVKKTITFSGDEEQVVSLSFTPDKAGVFDLEASIPARDDEVEKDNNSVSQRIRVIDDKIKVLLVEQSPRWEFRFLQNVLLRDRRVQLKTVLIEGGAGLSQAQDSPYLARIPAEKEELFKFDFIIIGDVDPRYLPPDTMNNLYDFVSKIGGSLACVAGRKFDPAAYKDTALEKLLPIELKAFDTSGRAVADRPRTLELTGLGRTNAMLQFTPNEDDNARIWKQLPPVFWVNEVSRAKPAAQVLVDDPDPARASRFGKMPVIALQQYGLGQVLYVGTDNLWRWRQNLGEDYYTTFWGQITQRMALAHLLGGSKRTQLTVDKQNYSTGDRVMVYARLYSETFDPIRAPSVEGSYTVKSAATSKDAAGETQSVQLRAAPEQPGMYRCEFVALAPGAYQFAVVNDPKTVVEFAVKEPKFELGETAMNEPLLREMATASGGEFFREEGLSKLAEVIGEKTERVRSTVETELWSSPFYFVLMISVITAEWILRKRAQLK
jgi:hypothetical protein